MIIQLTDGVDVYDFTGLSGSGIDYTAYDCTLTHDVSNDLISFPIPAESPTVVIGSCTPCDWSDSGVGGCEGFNIAMCTDLFTIRGIFRSINSF